MSHQNTAPARGDYWTMQNKFLKALFFMREIRLLQKNISQVYK